MAAAKTNIPVAGSVFAGAEYKPPTPVAKMHDGIDQRLDRLRTELSTLVPTKKPQERPWSAPLPEPPRKKDEAVLLYMPSFQTQQIRAARRAAAGKKNSLRSRQPPPGHRPLGYRIQTQHPSSPAYTMASKIVLSAYCDPSQPEPPG